VERIVVGVDGSAGSLAALRWGLAEARVRGVPLRVVHAFEVPRFNLGDVGMAGPGMPVPPVPPEEHDRLREAAEAQARHVVEAMLERAGGEQADGVDVSWETIEGPAVPVLLEAGRGAALLVLGSRGRGGFVGLLLGSVSQQCAQHPPCPVVILPPVEEVSAAA
jgi:nucleotide-binding universal stress UspA family protein